MADDKPKAQIEFIDNPHAPDLFVTDATGFFIMNGNIFITLEKFKVGYGAHHGQVSRVVTGRIVMPISDVKRVVQSLNEFLARNGHPPERVVVPIERGRTQ